jgi:ATP-dependent Clp protease ATP-binding subunit ClpC
MNFIIWYYKQAPGEFINIWKNYLNFFWKFFAVKKLLKTLFSPWKRDLFFKNWQGFHPILAIGNFITNIFFRFFGGLVRLFFVVICLIIEFFALIIGAFILILLLAFPLIVLFVAIGIFLEGEILSISSLLILIIFSVFIVVAYKQSQQKNYLKMNLTELYQQPWFNRIIEKAGLPVSEISKDVLADSNAFNDLLEFHDLTMEDFEKIVSWEVLSQTKKRQDKKFWNKENLSKIAPLGRYWTYGYTSDLNRYAIELTKFDPTVYRETELVGHQEALEMLKITLSRGSSNNAILMGDAGVGKKTLFHYLAKIIRSGQVEPSLKDKRIMLLDFGDAVSEIADRGENVENFLHNVFQESAYAGNIILVIENIGRYLQENSSINVASILVDYLPLPSFRIITTSTNRDYHKLIEGHENIIKSFETIKVPETNEEETLQILSQKYQPLEEKRIVFTYQAFSEIFEKSSSLGKIMSLPGRAIDLAEESLHYWSKNREEEYITPHTVNKVVSLKTGVAQGEVEGEEKEKLLNLESVIHQRVIGQEEAVRQTSEAIRKTRSGLGNKDKPIGSFLFLGPTGVGKTETAKALTEAYYGDEKKMVRFDMNDFQTPSAIDRIIGSTHTGQPGQLISAIKDNPYSLLLLDEIEKAHSNILDLFLQILDEGYLVDAFGEKISFTGVIIIATSNAGSVFIKKSVEEKIEPKEIKEQLIDLLVNEEKFKVEFLNRFDDVIFFGPLNQEALVEVTKLMLRKFADKLKEKKNINIKFETGIIEEIIQIGYDPVFGARSLNRYINNKIEDQVARKLLEGDIKRGGQLVIGVEDIEE